LGIEECQALLDELSSCDVPFQCAHGRPATSLVADLDRLPVHDKVGYLLRIEATLNTVSLIFLVRPRKTVDRLSLKSNCSIQRDHEYLILGAKTHSCSVISKTVRVC